MDWVADEAKRHKYVGNEGKEESRLESTVQ
jgi:hypothetical protein